MTFGDRLGVLHQVEKSCDRFDFVAAQIQRIEIELEVSEERQPRSNREPGDNQDWHPVTGHEAVDRSKLAVTDRLPVRAEA